MKRLLAAAVLFLPGPSFAQAVITLDRPVDDAPAAGSDEAKDRATGEWARGIMARAAGTEVKDDRAASVCEVPKDRKRHGEVWGEVGTGGYHSTGLIVTQPVGDCSSLTVGIETTDYGNTHRRRR